MSEEIHDGAGRRATVWPAAAALIAFLIGLSPIRNYDYFWHIAAGRWITRHRSIPETDPFSLTGAGQTWINLEWLFQILAYLTRSALGEAGISLLVAAGVAATVWWLIRSSQLPEWAAAATSVVCAAGASFRIDARPETASVPILLAICALAISRTTPRRSILTFILTVVWINLHPSALLSPMIVGAAVVNALIRRDQAGARIVQLAAASLALLANPWTLEGVLAPLRLTAQLETAAGFTNLEWRWSDPSIFPLFWVVLVISILILSTNLRETGLTRVLIFAGFAILAVRYGRNQIYFFAALPLLLPALPEQWNVRPLRIPVLFGAGLLAIWSLWNDPPSAGIAESRFPVETASIIETERLEGNIYNPDQLGGYLIWKFPDRRVLTDGRNELNREFIPRLGRALADQREWNTLLQDYQIDIALEEYRPPIEVVDGRTGEKRTIPASLAYFPRNRWALVGYDDVSMLFLRRAAFPPETILRLELPDVVPDVR